MESVSSKITKMNRFGEYIVGDENDSLCQFCGGKLIVKNIDPHEFLKFACDHETAHKLTAIGECDKCGELYELSFSIED